jgi:hypothetical protein
MVVLMLKQNTDMLQIPHEQPRVLGMLLLNLLGRPEHSLSITWFRQCVGGLSAK